jgi:hypothetical protein
MIYLWQENKPQNPKVVAGGGKWGGTKYVAKRMVCTFCANKNAASITKT